MRNVCLLIALLCVTMIVNQPMGGSRLAGGFSTERKASEEEMEMLKSVQMSMTEQTNGALKDWSIVSVSTQVVAGINYKFILSCPSCNANYQVNINKPLPYTNQPPSISKIERLA